NRSPVEPTTVRIIRRKAIEQDQGARDAGRAHPAQVDPLRGGVRDKAARPPEGGERGDYPEQLVQRLARALGDLAVRGGGDGGGGGGGGGGGVAVIAIGALAGWVAGGFFTASEAEVAGADSSCAGKLVSAANGADAKPASADIQAADFASFHRQAQIPAT